MIWLVAYIIIGGMPIQLMDERQPSIEVCFQKARQVLERATSVHADEAYEFQVTCSLVKDSEAPG